MSADEVVEEKDVLAWVQALLETWVADDAKDGA